MNRRALMKRAIYAIPLLIGGTLTACVGKYLFGGQKTQASGWTDAGEVSDIQGGTPHQIRFQRAVVDGWTVRAEESSAWVIVDGRQVTAFAPACTHLGCAYSWETDKRLFVCPCHGSKFNVRGDVMAGPATRPLDRYPTKIEGNRLWLGPVEGTEGS